MVRRHRLIELFLTELLDMPWDQVHAEAERLEHVLSEELEERIAAKLGQPTRDPHGDPIPRRDGTMEDVDGPLLSALPVGVRATVSRVQDGDPALLRYLGTLGLVPGAEVTVDGVAAYGDVMTVRVGATTHAVGAAVTRAVVVVTSDPASPDATPAPDATPGATR
jgi:DtxR family Mn-dependent transcriptional regulator